MFNNSKSSIINGLRNLFTHLGFLVPWCMPIGKTSFERTLRFVMEIKIGQSWLQEIGSPSILIPNFNAVFIWHLKCIERRWSD